MVLPTTVFTMRCLPNKKVLLRERKRHTERSASSTHMLSYPGGWVPWWGECTLGYPLPHPDLAGGTVDTLGGGIWMGWRVGTLGYPFPPIGTWWGKVPWGTSSPMSGPDRGLGTLDTPPHRDLVGVDTLGYPSPIGTWWGRYLWVPPPPWLGPGRGRYLGVPLPPTGVNRQTPVKTVPYRRTRSVIKLL